MSKMEIISEWFDDYSDDIYSFLVYYVGSSDVEDLVQDVFIKAIDHLDSFKQQSKPKTWLFSIARNIAIDEARKRKRSNWRKLLNFKEMTEWRDTNIPDEIITMNETKERLYQLIQSLKPNYRDVVFFRGIKEYSVAETASILNWSETKVRVTFFRALKLLQEKKGGFFYEQT